MKLTALTIGPANRYMPIGRDNPLRAVVTLASGNSTVECVLSDEATRRMLDLCAHEIARAAERQVRDFVAAVTAIDAGAGAALIGAA
ncbi:MAG: hypothetical protein IPM60_15120 [Rhodospirillales bacterium]|nr:hypothetical protein [Rhodospirillales bacterium]